MFLGYNGKSCSASLELPVVAHILWEMEAHAEKWVLLQTHRAYAQIPNIHHWICGQSCPVTAMMVWYCQRLIHVPWQTLREV